jgi:LDH2 family malate/lactate/ureidoglycolate dehydrogenase
MLVNSTDLQEHLALLLGFGFVAASLAMDKCIEIARVYGIGMASVKHSNHFGMSASFCLQAVEAGMMSLVFTNSSPAVTKLPTSISP